MVLPLGYGHCWPPKLMPANPTITFVATRNTSDQEQQNGPVKHTSHPSRGQQTAPSSSSESQHWGCLPGAAP